MVTRWDPFAEAVSMREAMNRLINDSFVRPSGSGITANLTNSMPFDVYESGDEVAVRLAVPGADPDQIDLTVNQGVLTVKGYRHFYDGDQEKQYTWHARGLPEGSFQWAASLPVAVNAEAASASYEGGILTIRLPKAETARARRIAVTSHPAQQALNAGS
jgi:HSP20 family protein